MTIKKVKSGYVLKSKSTVKTLGKHKTKKQAIKQEQAIQIAKHRKGKK